MRKRARDVLSCVCGGREASTYRGVEGQRRRPGGGGRSRTGPARVVAQGAGRADDGGGDKERVGSARRRRHRWSDRSLCGCVVSRACECEPSSGHCRSRRPARRPRSKLRRRSVARWRSIERAGVFGRWALAPLEEEALCAASQKIGLWCVSIDAHQRGWGGARVRVRIIVRRETKPRRPPKLLSSIGDPPIKGKSSLSRPGARRRAACLVALVASHPPNGSEKDAESIESNRLNRRLIDGPECKRN